MPSNPWLGVKVSPCDWITQQTCYHQESRISQVDPHASVSSAFVEIFARAEHRNKYYFIRFVNDGSVSQRGLCLTA